MCKPQVRYQLFSSQRPWDPGKRSGDELFLLKAQADLSRARVICRNWVRTHFSSHNFVFFHYIDARIAVKMLYEPPVMVHRLVDIVNIKMNRSFITGLFVLVHTGENAQLFMFLLDFSFKLHHLFHEKSLSNICTWPFFSSNHLSLSLFCWAFVGRMWKGDYLA